MFNWLATFLCLLGAWLNARKNVACWPIWVGCNLYWCAENARQEQYAETLLWFAYLLTALYGWYRWSEK